MCLNQFSFQYLGRYVIISVIFRLILLEPLCLVACPNYAPGYADNRPSKSFSLKDLLGDGILWAVPKHRKSLERRLKAKFGNPKYHMKIYSPKTTLRICMQCGHDHEVGVLCRKCNSRKENLLRQSVICN